MLLYVHRTRRLIRDGSPVRPPRLLIHTAPELCLFHSYLLVFYNRLSEKSWLACTVTHVLYLLCLNCPVLRLLIHTAPELCLFHSYLLVFYNRLSEKSWLACTVTHVLYLLCLNCPVLRILLAKYRTGPLVRCLLFRVPVGASAVSSKTDGE